MSANTDRIFDTVRAFMASRIVLTGIELGVFGALADGPRTSADLAAELGADPRATDRLLNALVVQRLLNKDGDLFSNSEAAEECLVPGRPGYAADGMMHTAYLWHTWTYLTDVVRTGKPAPRREADPKDRADAFIAAMHHNAVGRAPLTVGALDLAGVKRVLDVGGGSGDFAMAFCEAKPDITATVLDLPEILPITRGYLERAGMADRVDTWGADYLKDGFPTGYDMALLSAVIHSNSPEETQTIFRKTYGALNPGGRIVVQDFFMDENRVDPPAGALFALNMLVNTPAGDTYTVNETEEWLKGAGFQRIERTQVPGATTSLLIGTRDPL